MIDNGQIENAGTYFNQVMNRGVAPAIAFQQSFSDTPEAMDGKMGKYMVTALEPKPIYKPVELDPQTFVVTKYPEGEARAIEAQFKLDLPAQSEQGLNELRQMLTQDPNNVEVNRGLGIGYLRVGDLKSAADHLRRAIEIRDNDALMHYLIGVIRNRGSREAIQVDSEGPTIVMQMQRAIDLDPELAEAYQLLAEAQLATQHPAKALDSIKTGMTLSPRDEQLMLTFASVQMANSKYDEARGMLKFLQTSRDPEIAKRAGEMLVSAKHLSKSDQHWAEQGMKYSDPTAPQWRPTKTEEETVAAEAAKDKPAEVAKPDTRKMGYVKGTLLSVQCTDEKSATLMVNADKKTWTFKVADRSKALLIGVATFQCSWRDVPVSINYRASGTREGDVVSLEVD
jgi:Tfp pilus assembly protein PilF